MLTQKDLHLVAAGMMLVNTEYPGCGYQDAWKRVEQGIAELLGLADTLAGMTTEAEMDGDMSGDDAVSSLSDMIETARTMSPRRPAPWDQIDRSLPLDPKVGAPRSLATEAAVDAKGLKRDWTGHE